jgi:hypothetical protein
LVEFHDTRYLRRTAWTEEDDNVWVLRKRAVNVLSGLNILPCVSVVDFTDGGVTLQAY